jgi:hypothetical protein
VALPNDATIASDRKFAMSMATTANVRHQIIRVIGASDLTRFGFVVSIHASAKWRLDRFRVIGLRPLVSILMKSGVSESLYSGRALIT